MKKDIPQKYILVVIFFFFILILEWCVGFVANINPVVFITYLFFLALLVKENMRFVIEYSWLFVMTTLNILGVFVCDSYVIYLTELQRNTYYSNSFTPLVITYFIFFTSLFILENRSFERQDIVVHEQENKIMLQISGLLSIIGLAILFCSFVLVLNKPYFIIGVDRVTYQTNYLSGLEISIKRNLIIFIPPIMIYRKKSKIISNLFLITLVLYYFWTGDKFGTFLFLGYLLILIVFGNINKSKIKKMAIISISGCVLLLAIVFIQRILLYGDNFSEFLTYLMQRLAQQGQVWWSVYGNYKDHITNLKGIYDEFAVFKLFKNDNIATGQWKMMLVSADYSPISKYRFEIRQPYTATTTASLYYYFGLVGVFIFYLIIPFVYKKVITTGKNILKHNDVFLAMVMVKIMVLINGLFTASDLEIITYKGLIYLFIFYLLYQRNNKRILLKIGGLKI